MKYSVDMPAIVGEAGPTLLPLGPWQPTHVFDSMVALGVAAAAALPKTTPHVISKPVNILLFILSSLSPVGLNALIAGQQPS